MNKWLHKFMEKPDISDKPDNSDKWDGNLENMPGEGPDKPDRLGPNLNLSGLSGCSWGLLEENLKITPRQGGDKSDRFKLRANMSPHERGLLSALAVPLQGYLDQNLKNISPSCTDNTDRFNVDDYEERLAIAEYDGHQISLQAQRIAYLDAFMSVLATLPYEDGEGDWLGHRVQAAQERLLDQGIVQPK